MGQFMGRTLDLDCVTMIILILLFIGLFFWLENKVSKSSESNHYSKWKELLQISDEINSVFFQLDDDEHNNSAHCCACSICGGLSNVDSRCSRCKTATYCSNACHVMHQDFCHNVFGNQEESPSHGVQYLLTEPENDKYSVNEVEQKIYKADVYYIEGGENSVEFSDETMMPRHSIVNGNNKDCAVCGNPSSKVCSRCKAIKYCSRTCQRFDWRSGHKIECLAKKATSTEATMIIQERPDHGNVVNVPNSYEEEDNAYSTSPLCLDFYSGNTDSRALISSFLSQEATNTSQKKIEEQLRSLKEELAKIKYENNSLRSERDEWELQARNSIERFYIFKKENEYQLFTLKHENKLMSSAEKQARQMVNSLSQRLHCLQIAVQSGVEERKKQEEYIRTLQVSQPISFSRNSTFTRQGCSICLTNEKNMAFGCGHMACLECGIKICKCHICRTKITSRIRLFPD